MNSSKHYLTSVRKILEAISLEEIAQASAVLASALRSGGIIHTFGGGHSSLLAQEVFFRAGGLVAVSPLLNRRIGFECGALESTEFERLAQSADLLIRPGDFRRTDVGIVISNSGRNALPVEVAVRMKSAEMKVIAVTNLEQSRQSKSHHASGKRLFELADVILDNHCPPGDAAVTIAGIPTALGPVSTIAGAALLHSAFLGAAEILIEEGRTPEAFVSVNVDGATVDDLTTILNRHQERIRYYRPGGDSDCV